MVTDEGDDMVDQRAERAYGIFEDFAWRTTNTLELANFTTLGLRAVQDQHRESASAAHPPAASPSTGHLELEVEISRGFPITWAQSTAALWAHLEAYVEDFACFILDEDAKRRDAALEKVKVPILAFVNADDDERSHVIFQYLAGDCQAKERLTKFEPLLLRLGVKGKPIGEGLAGRINEWNHLRNIIVHRKGVAGTEFVKKWPDFPTVVGASVVVTSAQAAQYAQAGIAYGYSHLPEVYRRGSYV